MKKTILSLGTIFMVGISFVSCSKNADIQTFTQDQIIEAKYKEAFVKTFGAPAANQDWGFSKYNTTTTRAVIKKDMQGFGTAPADITDAERTYVTEWFQNNPGLTTEGRDWSKFYVQYVSGKVENEKGIWHRYDQNRERNGYDSNYYDEEFTDNGGMEYLEVGDGTTYQHLNDFNAKSGGPFGVIYVTEGSALQWRYKSSWDSNTYNYFKLAEIDVPGVGKGWYVGLSLYGKKYDNGEKELGIQRLQYAENWILKVVPDVPTKVVPDVPTPVCRIIAEDLSASAGSDFDFNDVVFDVAYEDENTIVTIQAAGGTLPLYVADQEVHKLFMDANPNAGVKENTMINTNASNGVSDLSPVTITITGKVAPQDIEIKVNKNGTLIPLKADVGQPAAKIAVDPSFVWCNERVDIRDEYSQFSDYVKDTNVQWY